MGEHIRPLHQTNEESVKTEGDNDDVFLWDKPASDVMAPPQSINWGPGNTVILKRNLNILMDNNRNNFIYSILHDKPRHVYLCRLETKCYTVQNIAVQ